MNLSKSLPQLLTLAVDRLRGDTLWRRKRDIPAWHMAVRCDPFSGRIGETVWFHVPDQLLSGYRVLAFGETGKLFLCDLSFKAPFFPACRSTGRLPPDCH